MKAQKKLLIIILGIFIFLICDQIRVSANSEKESIESNLNIENLIEYINNLDLSEEEIKNISEKSKLISEDIKGKSSFKDYKIKEVLKIYKNFNYMAKYLDLDIDFSIKNGDFTLKDKDNGNSIFKGNVSEIKKYFENIKNNTELLTMEVLANVENEDAKNKIEEVINSITDTNVETENYTQKVENDDKNIIESEKVSVEDNLINTKANNMILPISILAVAFFVIVISYIKFR